MSALSFSKLAVGYGERRVLEGLDLTLDEGSFWVVVGENGSGKTTVLRALLGGARVAAGGITLGGAAFDPMLHCPERVVVSTAADRRTPLTVEDYVSSVFRAKSPAFRRLTPHEARRAVEALAAVGCGALARRPTLELSDGEWARVRAARAVAPDAPLMLFDEPTAHLDMRHAIGLADTLKALSDAGHGVLVTTHDLNLFAPRATNAAMLARGGVYACGEARRVLTPRAIRDCFGVEAEGEFGVWRFRPA